MTDFQIFSKFSSYIMAVVHNACKSGSINSVFHSSGESLPHSLRRLLLLREVSVALTVIIGGGDSSSC